MNSNIINTDSLEKNNRHSAPEIRPKVENDSSNANSIFYTSKSEIKNQSFSGSYSNSFIHLLNEEKDYGGEEPCDNNLNDDNINNKNKLNNKMKDLKNLNENNEEKADGLETEEENILKQLEELKHKEIILKKKLKEIKKHKLNKKKGIFYRKEKVKQEKMDKIPEDKKEEKEEKEKEKEKRKDKEEED